MLCDKQTTPYAHQMDDFYWSRSVSVFNSIAQGQSSIIAVNMNDGQRLEEEDSIISWPICAVKIMHVLKLFLNYLYTETQRDTLFQYGKILIFQYKNFSILSGQKWRQKFNSFEK